MMRSIAFRTSSLFWIAPAAAAIVGILGCPLTFPPAGTTGSGAPVFNNTTDKTNRNASYIGSSACSACHPDIAARHVIHGHAHKLNRVQGAPPVFPAAGTRAGVPNPPEGFAWSDISYVIGGYTKKARFIDQDGFTLVTGVTGVDTQWNLDFPANGTVAGFVAYDASRETRKPYAFSCFQCHTTGPAEQDPAAPLFQENRPGFVGTWAEAGVQCEACHGPGSHHVPNPQARDNFVDSGSTQTCRRCHNRPFDDDSGEILASGGYIRHHEQWPELRASGGHSSFPCTTCHDPHTSVTYDRENAIRNHCTACHSSQTMALHEGKVFVRGDYVETLACQSCHMSFATKSASTASAAVVGDQGRMGDVRTHIFRINIENVDFNAMFTADGGKVVTDALGRAAVTLDFICLRCHNGKGSAFELTLEQASEIAFGIAETPHGSGG